MSSSKERKGSVWARVWEGLRFPEFRLGAVVPKLDGHSNAFRLKAAGFLTRPTSWEVLLWELSLVSLL